MKNIIKSCEESKYKRTLNFIGLYDVLKSNLIAFALFSVLLIHFLPANEPDYIWTEISLFSSAPKARYFALMDFDSKRKEMVLFGGLDKDGYLHNDTWTFDGTSWRELELSSSLPNSRILASMAFDSKRGQMVLFGGWDNVSGSCNDTWSFDGTAWTEISSSVPLPSARIAASMACDSKRGVIVLFGGWDVSGPRNDTWVFDGTNWTELFPSLPVPSARYASAMSFDSKRGQMVLFGGWDGRDYRNDIWVFDGTNWTELSPSLPCPNARIGTSMTFDSKKERMVLFGGSDVSGPCNDTWIFDGTEWAELFLPSHLPCARTDASMAFDSETGKVILFGGYDRSFFFNDTWSLCAMNLLNIRFLEEK